MISDPNVPIIQDSLVIYNNECEYINEIHFVLTCWDTNIGLPTGDVNYLVEVGNYQIARAYSLITNESDWTSKKLSKP